MDPYRLNLELLAACPSREAADDLLEQINEALPPGVILELGEVAPMDHRDVIDNSPLAALLYEVQKADT